MKEGTKSSQSALVFTVENQWKLNVSVAKIANKRSNVTRTRQNWDKILVYNYAFCCKKISRTIKNQVASELLSKLVIRTGLIDIPFIVDILFYDRNYLLCFSGRLLVFSGKFVLMVRRFLLELHLRQPRFTYKAFMSHLLNFLRGFKNSKK